MAGGPMQDPQLDPKDIVAIEQVLARYTHVMDARDWDGLARVFLQDAVLDYADLGCPVMNGLQEVRDFFDQAQHPVAHNLTSPVVESSAEDIAVVRSKWLNPAPDWSMSAGDFLDEFVRTVDGWRIARRTGTRRLNRRS